MKLHRKTPFCRAAGADGSARMRGFTMVELLVALVLGTLIALAAVTSLTVARRGFATVDAASQLRENARFASDMIKRVAYQGGFLDVPYAVNAIANNAASAVPPPYVFGFNNAVLNIATEPVPGDGLDGNRTATSAGCASSTDTACVNGADILVLRYQTPAKVVGGALGDKTTINCAGISQDNASTDRDQLAVSAFHVALDRGEPALMCSYQNASGVWQSAAQPVIKGVETFQVLYGVDEDADTVAERYLRADQITVEGNPGATEANWRRVRSLRIGMVLRDAPGSAKERSAGLFYPLGKDMWSAADPGTEFVPNDDGRLRQSVTLTVYLRNYVGL